jgi:L-histidine N-alpha-methyltransferase
VVRWPGAMRSFARGERIHTENSYKYRVEEFVNLLRCAGLPHAKVWTDERAWFAVVLARP